MIASCSQDSYVRIWSITNLDKNSQALDDKIKIEKKTFTILDQQWTTSLETVLSGHEGWVYSVHWHINGIFLHKCMCIDILNNNKDLY